MLIIVAITLLNYLTTSSKLLASQANPRKQISNFKKIESDFYRFLMVTEGEISVADMVEYQ